MFEITVLCPEAQIETLCDALQALDAMSVSVEDADAALPNEQALFGEPGMPPPKAGWQKSWVKALFENQALADGAQRTLSHQDFITECSFIGTREIADQDWVRLTQSQFAPAQITPEFWIVPTWHQAPAAAKTIITLDPGLAFGTGTHPTTRMCLRWIAHNAALVNGCRVLDYGCGSGILAIAAALHGAAAVDAVDIDEAAVGATRSNALSNRVTLNCGLPDLIQSMPGRYDLVLANILATPLKVLAPLLTSHVAPGGHLVLAGILDRQEQELISAYQPFAQLHVVDQEDGWILMVAKTA